MWNSTLIWTTLPAWLLSAYSAFWSSMLDELRLMQATLELYKWKERKLRTPNLLQPLARLRKGKRTVSPGGTERSTAKRALMLDYGGMPIFNAIKAARDGHLLLGLCMILRAALYIASGFSAAILSVAKVPFNTTADLNFENFFDENLGFYFGVGPVNTSSLAAFDIVSANLVDDGPGYPWTTATHSFLPFKPRLTTFGNYTSITEAYSSTLNCSLSDVKELERVGGIDVSKSTQANTTVASLAVHFSRLQCDVEKSFSLTDNVSQYARTWATNECSLAAGKARFGLIAGDYDDQSPILLSNFSLITCVPSFWRSNASVTVTLNGKSNSNGNANGSPNAGGSAAGGASVVRFAEMGQKESFSPFFWPRWIDNIPFYSTRDPALLVDMDVFGRLVYRYAAKQNPSRPFHFDQELLFESFQAVYTATFATFVTLNAYYPAYDASAGAVAPIESQPAQRTLEGQLTVPRARLFVVDQAAWAVVGIVAATLIVTLVLFTHLFRNRAITERHLDLRIILGHAFLLKDSPEAAAYLSEVEKHAGRDGDLVRYARDVPELAEWRTWLAQDDTFHIVPPPGSRGPSRNQNQGPSPTGTSSPTASPTPSTNPRTRPSPSPSTRQPQRSGSISYAAPATSRTSETTDVELQQLPPLRQSSPDPAIQSGPDPASGPRSDSR